MCAVEAIFFQSQYPAGRRILELLPCRIHSDMLRYGPRDASIIDRHFPRYDLSVVTPAGRELSTREWALTMNSLQFRIAAMPGFVSIILCTSLIPFASINSVGLQKMPVCHSKPGN